MAHDDKPSRTGEKQVSSDEHTSTRRKYLAGAGAASATALAGCSGLLGGGGSADTLSIAAVEGSGRLFKRLVDQYVEEDTGVTVDVELFPYANLFEKTSSVLSTQSSAYDIMFMDDPWFPQFASSLDPIKQWLPEPLPTEQLIDTVEDIATWPTPGAPKIPSAEGLDQKVRGQVVVGNTQLFAYNKKYYEQVGASTPPQTWGDVYEAGKKISDQIEGANGYIIRGKRGNPIMANFFALGNAIGGTMFNDNWRYGWAGQAGTNAVDFYVNKLKSISPQGVTSFDSDQVLNALASGEAAQAPAWPSAASLLLDPSAEQADNIQFTPIPKGHMGAQRQAPTQGNWIMGINSYISDAKKKSAGKVIRSAISKEAQDKYVDLGGVPFRHDTFKNNMSAQPWFPALYESLQTAQYRPRTPLWSEAAVKQGTLLNTALSGEISPEECTTQSQNQIESILESNGYYG